MNRSRSARFIALLFAIVASCVPAAAQSERFVLTIDGEIEGGEPVNFTLAELIALGSSAITTSTPWSEGASTYEGVSMSKLMVKIGATGGLAKVLALNNYRTSIPVSDFTKYPIILAWKQDGEFLTVRNKGPLFIIYPFDSDSDLAADTYYARSAWQVRQITISN